MSAAPARLAGLSSRKGAIAVGRDADLVVFDDEARFEVRPETIHFRHKVTPYLGRILRGRVRVVCAPGYRARTMRRARYDLVMANILARPLMLMARDLARALAPGGVAILAGILRRQEPMVLAAHRMQHLAMSQRLAIGGWSTLVLRRGAGGERRRT